MNPETKKIIIALIKQDITLSDLDKIRWIHLIKQPITKPYETAEVDLKPEEDRIVKREEAAKILGVCKKTLDKICQENNIHRQIFPNRVRGAGYGLKDILDLKNKSHSPVPPKQVYLSTDSL